MITDDDLARWGALFDPFNRAALDDLKLKVRQIAALFPASSDQVRDAARRRGWLLEREGARRE